MCCVMLWWVEGMHIWARWLGLGVYVRRGTGGLGRWGEGDGPYHSVGVLIWMVACGVVASGKCGVSWLVE